MRSALALALAAALAGPAQALAADPRFRTVEAVGQAAFVGDAAASRAQARDDALRSCVQQVAATLATPAGEVDEARRLAETIEARAVGYVRRLELLDDRQDGGAWVARVRCEVAEGRLEDDLAAAGLTLRRAGVGACAGERCALTRLALTVSGVEDYGRLAAFKAALLQHGRGVRGVQERAVEDGRAELEVTLAGTSEGLATDLATRRWGGFTVKVQERTATSLVVSLRPIAGREADAR